MGADCDGSFEIGQGVTRVEDNRDIARHHPPEQHTGAPADRAGVQLKQFCGAADGHHIEADEFEDEPVVPGQERCAGAERLPGRRAAVGHFPAAGAA